MYLDNDASVASILGQVNSGGQGQVHLDSYQVRQDHCRDKCVDNFYQLNLSITLFFHGVVDQSIKNHIIQSNLK